MAFFTSFCIEIEPSEQVVWLWKSPATYVPGVFATIVQFTCAVCVAAHEAAGSPSLTDSVTVARPGAAPHVKVGFAEVGLVMVPPVADHEYESGEGPASLS